MSFKSWFGKTMLKLKGWKMVGEIPEDIKKKCYHCSSAYEYRRFLYWTLLLLVYRASGTFSCKKRIFQAGLFGLAVEKTRGHTC